MQTKEAITLVERKHGSVEDFAWLLLNEHPEVIDGSYNLQKLAATLKMPMAAVSKVMNSPHFRTVMSQMVVQTEYTIADELKHVRTIKRDATNAKKNVNTRIAAREHLARLEGRPLNKQEGNVNVPIQVVFATLSDDVERIHIESVEGETYVPAKRSDLPPEGARRRYFTRDTGERLVHGVNPGDELDFYSPESPYALEDGKTVGHKKDNES